MKIEYGYIVAGEDRYPCQTAQVGELDKGLAFVSDSQVTAELKTDLPKELGLDDYDSFFVLVRDEEYVEVWGMYGIIPYNDRLVTRLV